MTAHAHQTTELLHRVLQNIRNPQHPSLRMSLANCHLPGLFSLVVDGEEFGTLTRVFIAGNTIHPFDVQLHTHRYGVRLSVLKGEINHHVAHKDPNGEVAISEYAYRSVLNGGNGLSYLGETRIHSHDYKLAPGSTVTLGAHDFHTMSCTAGSIWIVEELGYESEESRVLGIPFQTNGLYDQPTVRQIQEKCQQVQAVLEPILEAYRLVA